jgi:hypothetical protein
VASALNVLCNVSTVLAGAERPMASRHAGHMERAGFKVRDGILEITGLICEPAQDHEWGPLDGGNLQSTCTKGKEPK